MFAIATAVLRRDADELLDVDSGGFADVDDHTRIQRQIRITRLEHDVGRHETERGGCVAVDGVVSSDVGGGEAIEAGGQVELDRVGPGLEVIEEVQAVGVGEHAVDHHAAAVLQLNQGIGHADFVTVLQAILISIEPHIIAQLGELVEALVEGEVFTTRGQRGGGGHQGVGGHAVAVDRVIAALILRADADESGRLDELHRVGAGGQALEDVQAVGIGGRAVDHHAVAVLEVDRDIGDARFAGILNAVGIEIVPHKVAEAGELMEALVEGEVFTTRGQRGGRRHEQGQHAVAVDRIIAALIGGADAGEAGRLNELHGVRAGDEVLEDVEAGRVGRRAADDHAAAVLEVDRDILDARFAGILNAVGIDVVPHEVAQACELVEALVEGEVFTARSQRGGGGHQGVGGHAVAVDRVIAALILRADADESGRLDELHRVGAGGQALEDVQAVGIGGRAVDHHAVAVLEVDRDIGDARFAGILNAVGIEIVPHKVAEAGELMEALVEGEVFTTRGQRGGRRHEQGQHAVAVDRIIAALIGGADAGEAGRLNELHGVRAGDEVLEDVEAGRVGRRAADDHAAAVLEVDRDILDARFAGILNAVGIDVVPHEVAQACELVEALVEGEVGFASGQVGHSRHQQRADTVAVDRVIAALVGGADTSKAGRLDEHDLVIAGDEVIEEIETIGIGDVGQAGVEAVFEELDGDAGDRRFVAFLNAVGIDVVPDVVAEGGELDVHNIEALVGITFVLDGVIAGGKDAAVDQAQIGLEESTGAAVERGIEELTRGVHDVERKLAVGVEEGELDDRALQVGVSDEVGVDELDDGVPLQVAGAFNGLVRSLITVSQVRIDVPRRVRGAEVVEITGAASRPETTEAVTACGFQNEMAVVEPDAGKIIRRNEGAGRACRHTVLIDRRAVVKHLDVVGRVVDQVERDLARSRNVGDDFTDANNECPLEVVHEHATAAE